ncbi:hypothetical protein KA107_02690 [Candidatus Pacearchaeota archaeon]|nr:hypothetical protein [Candidatus Pacearchaeota archaeon]
MVNQIEALEMAMKINEQTLAVIAKRLQENPLDSRSLETRASCLGLLDEWIAEAEKVHQNMRVANFGKEQHNKYSSEPKYQISECSCPYSTQKNTDGGLK